MLEEELNSLEIKELEINRKRKKLIEELEDLTLKQKEQIAYALESPVNEKDINPDKLLIYISPEENYCPEHLKRLQLRIISTDISTDHPVSIELANCANQALESLLDKSEEEIKRIYSTKHERTLNYLAEQCGFEPIFERTFKLASQMLKNPIEGKYSPESFITFDSINALRGYLGKHREEYSKFLEDAKTKGLCPGTAIRNLAQAKQKSAVEYFIECFSLCKGKLDHEGYGDYIYHGQMRKTNFHYLLNYLIDAFGKNNLKKRFEEENPRMKKKLIKILKH